MMRHWAVLIWIGSLSFFPFGLDPFAGNQPGPFPPAGSSGASGFVLPQKHEIFPSRSAQRGRDLYDYYCAICHGKTGRADGFNAPNLATPPAEHADANRMAARTDLQLREIIGKGGPAFSLSPQMPPWGALLTDQEVSDLIAYIRVLPKPDGLERQR